MKLEFTDASIKGLAPPAGVTAKGKPQKDYLVRDATQPGLLVRVTLAASVGAVDGKSYLVEYTHAGMKRRVPIKPCGAISPAKARTAARVILGEAGKGLDPAGKRKEEKIAAKAQKAEDADTLDRVLEKFGAAHLADKSPSYAKESPRSIRAAFKDYLKLPITRLTSKIVVSKLDGIKAAGKPVMAKRTGDHLDTMCRWAIKRGYLTDNPAAGLDYKEPASRDRVLKNSELRAVMKAVEAPGVYNDIVKTLVYTGTRRDEAASMRWEELSPNRLTWTISGARTKNSQPHTVHLTKPMRELIARRPQVEGNPFVFPGAGEGAFTTFGHAKDALDQACGVESWRIHDLRRTFATGMQRLNIRLEVTENLLGHIGGASRKGVIAVYQRHDWVVEKRAALEAWAERVQAIVDGRIGDDEDEIAAANVIPFKQGA
jgi:integrase